MERPPAGPGPDGNHDVDAPAPGNDPSADTGMFRAFVARADEDEAVTERSATRFRLVTLVIGLVAFVVIAWLLLRL